MASSVDPPQRPVPATEAAELGPRVAELEARVEELERLLKDTVEELARIVVEDLAFV